MWGNFPLKSINKGFIIFSELKVRIVRDKNVIGNFEDKSKQRIHLIVLKIKTLDFTIYLGVQAGSLVYKICAYVKIKLYFQSKYFCNVALILDQRCKCGIKKYSVIA